MKQATISRLIQDRKFPEAASLLKGHIREAEIIDPRRDDSWGIDADILGYAILDHSGVDAFCTYWQDCLQFFKEELEPDWGHLHKGHIYLRLGTGYLATDLETAAENFNKGLEEDRLVAEQRRKSDPGLDVAETVHDSPAYITLCTARILDAWSYPSKAFKKQFFQDLVRVKFDVIWGPQEVDPLLVERALSRFDIAEKARAGEALEELNQVFDQRLSLATMSTLNSFLQIFLGEILSREILPSRTASAAESGFDASMHPSLTELLAAARTAGIFPAPTIAAVLQMAGILSSQFPFLRCAEIPEKLTPRVLSQISVMNKILVDLALIRWSEAL
ncbi:MAG: hypothetical protein JSV89_03020 [Spirochaetaceae bacterium]|nr:MAG: hypothetical protein JSV89_03020 [Spirochaetaceae bacterium]